MQKKKTVGERIRYLRKENGWTQANIADFLHVAEITVSSWERNRTEPDIETIIRISILFHVTTDYLLGKMDS